MTSLTEKSANLVARLLDKANAACDFDKAGDAADYCSALKDATAAYRDLQEDE